MSANTFSATGLTCGHCVGAVTEEITAIDGVSDVQVELVKGGASIITVTAAQPVTAAQVAAALDEAGNYQLA
ncbi:heavy-metal-associated domain-containing protein [Tomitella biformata]|uniref:heavy-metal-associated domain-containing protein n=1 Tax=Tomitella biformata TaxID=630403 RepID=UPI000465A026|nr:heavy-metal-associated domain-containing protein [Tomitella biformata]